MNGTSKPKFTPPTTGLTMHLSRWIVTASTCILVLLQLMAAAEPARAGAHVLLLGKQPDHPRGTHMYLHTCDILAKCLHQTDGVTTAVSDGWPQDERLLQDVATIVVYASPAAEMLLDGPHRKDVDALMRQGVGLVTIHWASAVHQDNLARLGDRWMSYLGGTWVSNVGLSVGESRLRQLDPDHPVCRGWSEYELHDEYYLNPIITDTAQPLLQVTTDGQDVVVGWAYERPDGGRAYGTTLGHFYRNFQQTAFRRAIVNAILWTARVGVPQQGAPVALTQQQLQMPPEKSAAP